MSIALERTARTTRNERAIILRAVWTLWACAGAAMAAGCAALRAGLVIARTDGVCWLRSVAHVACPTCGLTRSLTLLMRGDFAGSISAHPWGVLLSVQIVAGWLAWGLWNAGALRARPDRWLPHAFALNAAALAAIWLARFASDTLP